MKRRDNDGGHGPPPPRELVEAAIVAARDAARPVADLPIEAIAARAGISRATLYRRIGTKQALLDAVAATGVDPGGRPSIRQRAITSAAHLIAEEGLNALTMDLLATRADCAPATLYNVFGTRDDLIQAVFESYSPLPAITRDLPKSPDSLERALEAVVRAVLRAVLAPPRILPALISEALAQPDGPLFRYLTEEYIPAAGTRLAAYLSDAAERTTPDAVPAVFAASVMGPPAVLSIAAAMHPGFRRQIEHDGLDALASALAATMLHGLDG